MGEDLKIVIGGCYLRPLTGDIFQLKRVSADDPNVGIFRTIKGKEYNSSYIQYRDEDGETVSKWRLKSTYTTVLMYSDEETYNNNLKNILK